MAEGFPGEGLGFRVYGLGFRGHSIPSHAGNQSREKPVKKLSKHQFSSFIPHMP